MEFIDSLIGARLVGLEARISMLENEINELTGGCQ